MDTSDLIYIPRTHVQRTARAGLAALVAFSMFSYPAYVFPLLLLFPILIGTSGCLSLKCISIPRWLLACSMPFVFSIGIQSVIEISFYEKASRKIRQLLDTPHTISVQFIDANYRKLAYSDSFIGLYTAYLSQYHNIEKMQQLPPSSELYCEIGNAFAETRNTDKAIEYYTLAANMIPTRVLPRYLLWKLEVQSNNTENAINIAKTIIGQQTKIENTFTIRVRAEMKKYLDSNDFMINIYE